MSGAITNSISDDAIYNGAWTNWSKGGAIKGATLTLTHRDGGLLTAFLALFVTFAGRSFWRLFCFIAHACLSAGATPQDGLYHQRQAILRNATTGFIGLQYFVQLGWGWRNKALKSWLRIIPLITVTALLVVSFYVAGIFSSQISTATGDEVLISSPRCGLLAAWQAETKEEYFGDFLKYSSKLNTAGAAYAQQCYGNNATAQECSIFVKKEIPALVSGNASCPFAGGDKICLRKSNLRIDTGMIDSHEHMGINAAPPDRVQLRRVTECAPLKTEDYTRLANSTDGTPTQNLVEYLYGGLLNGTENSTDLVTYRYHAPQSGYIYHNPDYTIDIEQFASGGHSFMPIPELHRDDADMFLVFLSANDIGFLYPVDDEWYSAHRPVSTMKTSDENGAMPAYGFDQAASVLGCIYQHQVCNPSKNHCTRLADAQNVFAEADTLWTTDKQNQTWQIWNAAFSGLSSQPEGILENLGVSALIARDTLNNGKQGPLQPDQWEQEVLHWNAISMAKIQRSVIEEAIGSSDPSMTKYVEKPTDPAGKEVCKSQKIRSASHTSFSVLGLAITLIIGGCIIVAAHTIAPILQYIQRRRNTGVYRRLEWAANEVLQVQRMAHEELGSGTWSTDGIIPVTTQGEKLAVLDVSDETHPTLAPTSSFDKDDRRVNGELDKETLGKLAIRNDEIRELSSPIAESPNETLDGKSPTTLVGVVSHETMEKSVLPSEKRDTAPL